MKSNKKVLLIIGIILIIIAIILMAALGSYLMYQVLKSDSSLIERNQNKKFQYNTQGVEGDSIIKQSEITKKQEVLKSSGITNIVSKDLYDTQNEESFEVGSNKFVLYPLNDESSGEIKERRFEAFQNNKIIYSSDNIYNIANIFSFDFNHDTYVVVTTYSGGAHCCFTQYIFYIDPDDKLSLAKELVTNNSTISPENFFTEDNNLYLSVLDDRFAYFYTSYASSYAFPRYYRFEGSNIIDANQDFKSIYNKEAKRCSDDLDNINPSDVYSMEDWFPTLVCKTANYWHGGEEDKAWNNFNEYFSKFNASENPDNVQKEMEKILKEEY